MTPGTVGSIISNESLSIDSSLVDYLLSCTHFWTDGCDDIDDVWNVVIVAFLFLLFSFSFLLPPEHSHFAKVPTKEARRGHGRNIIVIQSKEEENGVDY